MFIIFNNLEWWPGRELNPRRRPFQGRALPLSYLAVEMFREGNSAHAWNVTAGMLLAEYTNARVECKAISRQGGENRILPASLNRGPDSHNLTSWGSL